MQGLGLSGSLVGEGTSAKASGSVWFAGSLITAATRKTPGQLTWPLLLQVPAGHLLRPMVATAERT